MFRLVVLCLMIASCMATSPNSTKNFYPMKMHTNISIDDIIVLNRTNTSVCITTVPNLKYNTSDPSQCNVGCSHCSYMCEKLYGMTWSCCQGIYCCCYPSSGQCAQPNVSCTWNYC